MRRLVVIRHAEAKRTAERGDHGRRLSRRGRDQAAALRAWTADGPLEAVRGTVVVSDASRTLETFELALAGTPCCERGVVDPSLYNGRRHVSTRDVLDALAAADPGRGDLLLVGHNPTVLDVVIDLCEDGGAAEAALAAQGGFPLCGVAILDVHGEAPAARGCALSFLGAPSTTAARG